MNFLERWALYFVLTLVLVSIVGSVSLVTFVVGIFASAVVSGARTLHVAGKRHEISGG